MAKKEKKAKSKLRKVIEGIFTSIFVMLLVFGTFLMIFNQVSAKKSGNQSAPTRIGNYYLPVLVLTNSMEPEYKVDSAVFCKKVSCEKIVEDFNNGKNVDLTFYDHFTPSSYSVDVQNFLFSYDKNNRTDNVNFTITHRLFYVEVHEDVEYGKGKYYFFVEGINRNSGYISAPQQYQVFTENELYGVVYGNSMFVGKFFKFVTSPWGLVILLLIPAGYMIFSSILDLIKAEDDGNDDNNDKDNPLSKLSKKDQKRLKEELLNELIGGNGGK